ncbi:MAG: hypothetical protein ACLFPX_07325 [Candidatus Omnitrophota bacterium]
MKPVEMSLEDILALVDEAVRIFFLLSADGEIHSAVAEGLTTAEAECLAVSGWFSAGITEMAQESGAGGVLIVADTDEQTADVYLTGTVRAVRQAAVLDGIVAGEEQEQVPQVKQEIIIHPEKIFRI